MTLLTAPATRATSPRRSTFVPGPRATPHLTAHGLALTAVVSGAVALAACAATLSVTFL